MASKGFHPVSPVDISPPTRNGRTVLKAAERRPLKTGYSTGHLSFSELESSHSPGCQVTISPGILLKNGSVRSDVIDQWPDHTIVVIKKSIVFVTTDTWREGLLPFAVYHEIVFMMQMKTIPGSWFP